MSSFVGTIMSGIFNYLDDPTLGEVLVYVAFLAVTLTLFFPLGREGDRRRHRRRCAKAAIVMIEHALNRGAPARHLQLLGVAGSAFLAIASGGLFYYAIQFSARPKPDEIHKVVVREKTCEPNALSVPAGRVTFEIHNASNRVLEWEILDGVLVVEERENIVPGFHARLTAQTRRGRIRSPAAFCPNPRGTLTVTPSAQSEAERKKPPVRSFVGPLIGIRYYLVLQSGALEKETRKLKDAIDAGDLSKAREAYLAARLSFRHIESVASRFADLQSAIDPVADYLEKREADPAFTGFHRIEFGLFEKKSLDGLEPVAEKLLNDVVTLKTRLRELKLAPEDLLQACNAKAGSGGWPHCQGRKPICAERSRRTSGGARRAGEGRWPFHIAGRWCGARCQPVRPAEYRIHQDDARRPQGCGWLSSIRSRRRVGKDRLANGFGALADNIDKLNKALGLE